MAPAPLEVWRICRAPYARFDGEGARRAGGRWNHPGTAMVYTSGSLSLACLELFVHLDPSDVGNDFVAIRAEIRPAVRVEVVAAAALPRGWDRTPFSRRARDFGSAWVKGATAAVLRVPSAVVPREWNYLSNPAHPDFAAITVAKPERFRFDPRLVRTRGASGAGRGRASSA